MTIEIIIRENGVEEVVYTVSDIHRAVAEANVICCKEWLKDGPLNFIKGKIEACQDRLIKEWTPTLAQEHEMLPSNKDALCQMIIERPDYLSRVEKDEAAALAVQGE